MRRAGLLIAVLLIAAPAAADTSGDPAVDTAADAVAKAVLAKDQPALEVLAAKRDPDAWLVADELLRRGKPECATALAKAAGADALQTYIAGEADRGDLTKARATLGEVLKAMRARDAPTVLKATATIEAPLESMVGIRLRQARAGVLQVTGRTPDAIALLGQVAKAAEALGWLRRAAELHNRVGQINAQMFELQGAVDAWSERLRISKEMGDDHGVVASLNNVGLALQQMGRLDAAMERYESALKLIEALDDPQLRGMLISNLAIVHQVRGALSTALDYYHQGLKLVQQSGDARNASIMLANIAAVHEERGELRKALRTYERALAMRRELGDAKLIALGIGEVGSAHHSMGSYAKALTAYEESIEKLLALGDSIEAAGVLNNLSGVYLELDELDRAFATGKRAWTLKQKAGDVGGAALIQGNLGLVLARQGEHARAIEAFSAAIDTLDKYGVIHLSQTLRANLGAAQLEADQTDAAIKTLTAALERQRQMGMRLAQVSTLLSLGRAHRKNGDADRARDALQEAERTARRLRAASLHVAALASLARLDLETGNSGTALSAALRALERLESVLGGLGEERGTGARELYTSVFATGTLAAIREDDVAEALNFLESGRAGALLDVLGKREEMRWKAEALPEELRNAEEAARVAERSARRDYDAAVQTGKRRAVREASKALDAKGDALRAVVGRIQRALKNQAQLFYPRAEPLETIQESLTDGQALVVYGLCRDEALAIVLERDAERVVSLGSVEAVTEACAALDLSDAQQEPAAALAQVRKLLIEPLALANTVTQVLIAPEGPLCNLPYGALVTDRTVALTPSGSTHVLLKQEARSGGSGVLALGAPDYSGASSGAQAIYYRGKPLIPLPGTKLEAETVGTKALVGAEATEAGFRTALGTSDRWRAIHLACHGLVRSDRPMLSSLALTRAGDDDGFLTALEILRMEIPADLAVLAACETARGRVVAGEGIVGLSRAFMFAGSPRVICSLWKVDDAASQALMVKFYELWNPAEGKGLGAAEALRAAQAHVRAQEKWAHPYYWAAWVLWGLPD